MKKVTCFLWCIFLFFACENAGLQNDAEQPQQLETAPAVQSPDATETTAPATTTPSSSSPATDEAMNGISAATATLPEKHDCKLKGKILDENEFWVKEKYCLIGIVATEKTKDKNFGDSHRVLQVLNTNGCKQSFEKILAVNRSPDFPYYLAKDVYQKNDDFVVIQGVGNLYFYDIAKKQISPPIEPQFRNEPALVDAQSGMINGRGRHRDFIFGQARDIGTFAVNVDTKKALLPAAGYAGNELYFLPDGNENFYAVIPVIDEDGALGSCNSLFKNAQKINPALPPNVRNNRYLVLKTNPGTTPAKHIAIDMKTGKEIVLPKDVAILKTGEILDWIK